MWHAPSFVVKYIIIQVLTKGRYLGKSDEHDTGNYSVYVVRTFCRTPVEDGRSKSMQPRA